MSRIHRRVIVSRRLARAYLAQVAQTASPEVVVYSSRPNVFVRVARSTDEVDRAIHHGRVAYRVSRDAQKRTFVSFVGDPGVLAKVREFALERGLLVGGNG